jgi:hypothetical protein
MISMIYHGKFDASRTEQRESSGEFVRISYGERHSEAGPLTNPPAWTRLWEGFIIRRNES